MYAENRMDICSEALYLVFVITLNLVIAWLVKWCNECLMIYVGLQTSGSSMRVVWWSVVGGTVPCGEPTPDVIPAGSGLDPLLCYTLVNTLQRPYQKQDKVTPCQCDISFINSMKCYFATTIRRIKLSFSPNCCTFLCPT